MISSMEKERKNGRMEQLLKGITMKGKKLATGNFILKMEVGKLCHLFFFFFCYKGQI